MAAEIKVLTAKFAKRSAKNAKSSKLGHRLAHISASNLRALVLHFLVC